MENQGKDICLDDLCFEVLTSTMTYVSYKPDFEVFLSSSCVKNIAFQALIAFCHGNETFF
jgi:hypothetical protein